MLFPIALWLAGGTAAAGPPACLPAADGYLSARLHGAIETRLDWREPAIACTGMPRPDGQGLRLRFEGPLPGAGRLAIVIAAHRLPEGESARGLPVNVTLLDEGRQRIYGTRGDGRCTLDRIVQTPLTSPGLPPRSFRVEGRGFCTEPALALDGEGRVLLTRFDFAGRVSWEDGGAGGDTPEPLRGFEETAVVIESGRARHAFRVWLARSDAERQQGLMHVADMADDRGMLFQFEPPQPVAFWMKDTPQSLDILFIGADGRIERITAGTRPFSRDPIPSRGRVAQVLELKAGTAARLGIQVGDRVRAARASP